MVISLHSGAMRTLTVRRLRFPFAVTCDTNGPDAWFEKDGHGRPLRQAEHVLVPPLTAIDIGVCGSTTVSIRHGLEPAGRTLRSAKQLACTLALNVFRAPALPWNRSVFGATVMLPNADISRKLQAENESFLHIVRQQRLMRVFTDLCQMGAVNDEFARKYGFSHRHPLELAFHEQFDVDLSELHATLARQRYGASRPSQPAQGGAGIPPASRKVGQALREGQFDLY